MAYVFIDESGDLGFSKHSSTWFLFTILLTNSHRPVEKVIKKIHKSLRKKYKHTHELHAYHSQPGVKKMVLSQLAGLKDIKVLCVALNKKKVYVDLHSQKNYLYNYTANILLDRLYTSHVLDVTDIIEICIDQKDTNRHTRENFEQYLNTKISDWKHKKIRMRLRPSHTEKCLQAVDFISWAIFRKYEYGDEEYYSLIKNKIIGESLLFPE